MDPNWIRGFVDAEGCFSIIILKRSQLKTGWGVEAKFSIVLHEKDRIILELVQSYFGGIGKIYPHGKIGVQFQVSSLQELTNIIIPFFNKYPLITQKKVDFILFKEIVDLMSRKEHLTIEGLRKILALKASLNLGLSENLKVAFPNVIPVKRPLVEDQMIDDPYWVAGFISGEGCFFINIKPSTHKSGYQVLLVFQVSQHSRDEQLMKSLISYFGCGHITSRNNKNYVEFVVTRFEYLFEKVIPFFDKYQIIGVKSKDYSDFKKVAELMKNKAHLTPEGLDQIRLIKAGMNRGRN